MSYILDALRRAERERNLGKAPSLQVVMQHDAAETPRNTARLLLIAVTLLAVAGAIAALLLRQPSTPEPRTPETLAVTPATPAAPEAAAEPPGEAPELNSLDDLAEPEPAPIASAEAEPDLGEIAEPVVALQPEDLQQSAPPPSPADAEVAPTPSLAPSPTQAANAGSVPLLRDLPPAYRADFPALSVEVHVFDRLPEKRWIMIGGRRYREGEVLGEGPRIVEINEEGIVFDYRGQQSLYPIIR
jgi:general secretion pathway protein B